MAIRAELSADPDEGPGHGLLAITGLSSDSGPLHFSLCSNQGTTPFLGPDGRWQAAEAWHEAAETAANSGGTVIVPLGPIVTDRIVEQPSTVTYRLTVTIGASSHVTSLRLIRPLFGSGAAAVDPALANRLRLEDEARRQREEEERLRLEAEETARRRTEDEEKARLLAEEEERRQVADAEKQAAESGTAEVVEPHRIRWSLIVGGLVLLAALAGAGVWYSCALPGFGPERCQGAVAPSLSPPIAAIPKSCSGLDAAACYQVGQQALRQNQLEPARQLLQQASGLGSAEGSLAVARMYDPDTWSAASSPVGKADWETAVFWYEKAAAQGHIEAKVVAGKLLCANATMDIERSQGRSYLEQAARAGNEQAKQLLVTCP
ncbi:MAG: sel1 repeat family protein [Rhodospirillales bacterium]|nr:sel1 repeat family protein [Rhodospirillales bacterium]